MITKPAIIKTAQAETINPVNNTEFNYQEFDRITQGKYPILKKIGECESGFRMVKNKASSAYGIFQILKMHDSKGNRMTVEGNIKIAIQLYQAQGTTPWNSSKACWSKK